MPLSRQLLICAVLQFVVCAIMFVIGCHFSGICLGAAWGVAMHRDAIKREQAEHEAYIADIMSP